MKSINFHTLSKYVLNLIGFLSLIVPFYDVFIPLEYDAYWKRCYFWNSADVVTYVLPFLLLWSFIQFKIFLKAQKILTYLMYTVGVFYILWFIAYFTLLAQDFIPSIGLLIMIFILPIFIIHQSTKTTNLSKIQ